MQDRTEDPTRAYLLERLALVEARREAAPPGSVARLEAAAEARDIRSMLAEPLTRSAEARRPEGERPTPH